MGNVGGLEVLVVLLVALVVLGPEKLPEAVRKVGNVVGELRRVSKSFQDEMRSAAMLDDIGLETTARERGDAAVAASKANQASLEPTGRSLEENTEPFKNTAEETEETEEPEEGAAEDVDDVENTSEPDNIADADADDDGDTPRIESDA